MVNWEPTWEAAKMIRSNLNYYAKMAEEYETSIMSLASHAQSVAATNRVTEQLAGDN